ncbi:MAG: hypothetical protein ACRDR6_12150 [Pseudonocardiaceae bacterium]
MAGSDAAKVTAPGWVVVGAGLLAYGSSFLPWYTANVSVLSIDRSASQDAWHAGTGAWLSVLLLVVASVSALVRTSVPLGRTTAGALITLGASVLGLVTLVLRWVTFPDAGGGLGEPISLGDLGEIDLSGAFTVSSGAGAGLYLGLIAAIAAVAASVVTFRAAGRNSL